MLEPIYKEGKDIFPKIVLDQQKGLFEISGRSLPEDVDSFYNRIVTWIQKYVQEPNPETEFNFKLDYYNSSTARKIVDILILLETIKTKGCKITVYWFYDESDDVLRESGEDFKAVIKVPFVLKPY